MKWSVVLLVSLCFGLSAAKCRFRRGEDWSACSPEGLSTRQDTLKADKSDATCTAIRTLTRACRKECQYVRRRRATWSECEVATNTVTTQRSLVRGDGCPAEVSEVFDCRVQRRFSNKPAAKKGQKKQQKKAQRKQERKQQRRLARKERRQERRQQRRQSQQTPQN